MKTVSESLVIELAEFVNVHAGHLEELFTKKELEVYGKSNGYRSLAARYLAKEIIKRNTRFAYTDIEILNSSSGKPEVILMTPDLSLNSKKIHCSLSHSRNYVAALVIMEVNEDE